MTSLTEVAADVAAALGLERHVDNEGLIYWVDDMAVLEADNGEYGLTDPYWRCRCEDWLHERGSIVFGREDIRGAALKTVQGWIEVSSPWPEAPARLVSAVWRRMKEKT